MSQEDYETRLRSVNRFVPFLENMIAQLKDPKMKNREQQLSKMESLHQMITDKNKKLKQDTLQKCEEVIIKLYRKVKGEHATFPPLPNAKKEEKRKPINLYSLAGESLHKQDTEALYGHTSGSKQQKTKNFSIRKPPISYSDLECLEKDVAHELEKKMSLNELNSLRNKLCKELEDAKTDQINTTVRNKPVLMKMNATSPDKNKKKSENVCAKNEPKKDQAKKTEGVTTAPKVIKEAGDLFCNVFSEIDKTYEVGVKRKDEKKRKDSLNDDSNDSASLKHLSQKAALLRSAKNEDSDVKKDVDPIKNEASVNKPKAIPIKIYSKSELEIGTIPLKIPTREKEDSVTNKINVKSDKCKSENKSDVDKTSDVKKSGKDKVNEKDRKHGEHKKDKSHKKDHKRNDRSHKKDKEDKHKDKSKKENEREKERKGKESKDNASEVVKESRNEIAKDSAVIQDVLKKIHSEIDSIKEKTAEEELTKRINENMSAEHKIPEPPEANKPINRDPRLKYGTITNAPPKNSDTSERLAFKYNPKPKKQNVSDIDANVVESIEKSMKESSIPLPPPPPKISNDLFSPESPDEMDKVAVPPILNDLLLNPKTTGMINDVVSALRRSNHDNNLISISTNINICKDLGYSVVNQAQNLHFSPPVPKLQFDPPPVETPLFPVKPQSALYNPFSPTDQNETEGTDYHPRNQLHFEPPAQGHFEDRMTNPFFMERTQGFVAPTANFPNPSSFIPPSPSYVPPSPLYETGNSDSFRDVNYQNYQQSNPSLFYETDRGLNRPKGMLGDTTSRLPYNQQYVQNNFDTYRFGQRGNNLDPRIGNVMDPRSGYYGASRDPRIHMRSHQFAQDVRPIVRENRMTYREYKEQKEREMREKEVREKDSKKEMEEIEQKSNEKETETKQKDTETDKVTEIDDGESSRSRDRNGRSRPRDRNRERNRSRSRYRRDDYRNRRERSRDRSRFNDSKFDKVYSAREKDDAPLNNIFPKTSGKGYGTQYKIPKKVKEEEKPKEEEETSELKVKKDTDEGSKREKKQRKEKKPEDDVVEIKKEDVVVEADKTPEIKPEPTEKKEDKTEKPEETIDKPPEKKEEEENILSIFFQNLMKSGNKDEKKGALLSLISTFSDSFSDQQLQKITNIIRSEDGDEEPTKETKEETQPTEKEIEKPEETPSIPDSQDTVESEKMEEETEEESEHKMEEVMDSCTTRSKLKNRRKSELAKPETKCKMKVKSELDRLHDDIREMFIRDGVVTATGKRMCRILKDSSGSPSTENEKTEDEPNTEDTEKKATPTKKKTRKAGLRKIRDSPEVEMKELTVVLPKMSLEKMKIPESEEEEETHEASDDETSDKEEKISPAKKNKQKKRNCWASGVIKKKPGPKSKKQDVVKSNKNKNEDEPEVNEEETEENPHDINYYTLPGRKSLSCKYCNLTTQWMGAHYRSEHPNKEVLSSRIAPNVARWLIEDSIKNKDIYENDQEQSQSKFDYLCSFCDYKMTTMPKFYRDHVTIHTGEFRHTCPYCNFSRSHLKTMQGHVNEAHAEEEATNKKPLISQRATNFRNVYAYICELCNFTQMNLDNVKKHVKTYHKKCEIHKIKLNQDVKIDEEEHSRPPSSASDSKSHQDEKTDEEEVVPPPTGRATRRSRNKKACYREKDIEPPVLQPEEPLEDVAVKPVQTRKKGGKKPRKPPQQSDQEPPQSDQEPPQSDKEPEKLEDVSQKSELGATVEDCETSTTEIEEESSTETESRRQTRKRGKPFNAPPSPAKKRLRRRCTIKALDDDDDKKEEKKVDEAVFTSNTDIQEENKRIEEERMKTMQDLNSTIKLRTSLDFVEKLSHRLKQEEEVVIKQEVEENEEDVLEKLPVNHLPVFEKSAIQNRETELTPTRPEIPPKVVKDSGRVNPVCGVIEKLQGILGNPTPSDDIPSPAVSNDESSQPPMDDEEDLPPPLQIIVNSPKTEPMNENNLPPPLIHMDTLNQAADKNSIINSETLNIGYVKVMKTTSTYIYVCCLPPCIFSSRDRTAFANHCQHNHQFNETTPTSTQCLECGTLVQSGDDRNVLSSAFDHVINAHSDFFGAKIGSIRISSNLFPKEAELEEEEDRSTPPTISIPSPPDGQMQDDLDSLLEQEEEPKEEEEEEADNPFAFKIVNVISLADDDQPALNTSEDNVETQNVEPEVSQIQIQATSSSPVAKPVSPLLSKFLSKQKPIIQRKSPIALSKFLLNYSDLYKCPDYSCLFTTNKRKMFDIHLKMHPTHKKIINCLYCDQFLLFENSGQHYEKMHGMCRFSCTYCLYRCIAKDYMDIHQMLAHPDSPSRMQLLPKRDAEEKSTINILNEVSKSNPTNKFMCCDMEFAYQAPFVEHLKNCPNKVELRCFFNGKNQAGCQGMNGHGTVKELLTHWGNAHGVYPLRCAYCSAGDFDMNSMLVHLALEHPTLPPEVLDRFNVPPRNKKTPPIVQCNFKQLIKELKSTTGGVVIKQDTPTQPSTPPTMQKAFENFALAPPPQKISPTKVANYAKLTPISLIQSPSPPSLALLKPTTKASVLNAGGVVYCISPAPANQNSVLKAIVVNKDGAKTTQKMQLVAPLTPTKDGKFQIVSKMNLPKLTPLNVAPTPVVNDDGVDMDLEEPIMVIDDDFAAKETADAVDPLSLEPEESSATQNPSKSPAQYDSDQPDAVLLQKTGLVGHQLFRCAKCEIAFPGGVQFKEHLINSDRCKFDESSAKPYKCYHCGKYLKHYTNLMDHLGYHGHPRFTCSLCDKQFPHVNQARYHMKTQHNVQQVQMQPLAQNKTNLISDSFIAKPLALGSLKPIVKETGGGENETPKTSDVKTVYFSFEADQIPQKSILGYDITCGHCKKFKNKVRSNIVRHLLLHENDKDFTVPDTAPVNPVPCLEKNEKMFDKMYNLASSSHTGGRMGNQQKGETKKDKVKDTNHPEFVPANKRYQCCAVGCNYLCLEEGNLRHHLTALHMEDLSFVCVHCKRDLSDAVDVDTIIKHLKLHDLHLYKCSACDYMHNLKHKIERHIQEDHKNKDCTVVVIRALDAEPFDENQQQQQLQPFAAAAAAVTPQKSQKPWRCCMCKSRCHTEEDVVNHVKNKHNIDCRYKCALCTFKTNETAEFREHFAADHADNDIDIISVYHKEDETAGAVSESEQFDTTPLWSRDKPRVRHIRGILFEDDPTMKKKTGVAKSDQTVKEATVTASTKKRKRSMSVAGELNKIEEEVVEPKKEALEQPKKTLEDQSNDVIVIEDDEKEDARPTENAEEPEEVTDVDLICRYGDFGMPLNKHFKCPKCEKYRTTKMRDFVQHVTGELRYYRFLCTICQEKFVTLENIQMHCIDYHDCSVKSVVHLPVNVNINKWLTLLLTEQRNIIKGLGFACDEIPEQIEDFLGSLEISSNKPIKCKECGFSVSGPTALDRHMKYNHPHVAFAPRASPNASSPQVVVVVDAPASADKKRRAANDQKAAPEPKKPKTTGRTNVPASKDKYVCNSCGQGFYSVPEMEYHGKENHDGLVEYTVKQTDLQIACSGGVRNLYRCRYCPTTGSKANMETHIMGDHPGHKLDLYKFACGVCPAKFEVLKSFRQHFKSHDLPTIFYYDVHDRRVDLGPSATQFFKQKKYKCPVCAHTSNSVNSGNIKLHLKMHFRPLRCDLCETTWKTRAEAKAHHAKEHPHNAEVISVRQDMVEMIDKMMEKIMKTTDEVDLSNLMDVATLQPEVVLRTDEDESVNVETVEEESSTSDKRYFARKSTGLNVKPDETKEFYSFYGLRPERVDMKKIVTNFEVADAQMKMSCDQLGRIYNLNPVVRLKDCMTLIIDDDDDDDDVSS